MRSSSSSKKSLTKSLTRRKLSKRKKSKRKKISVRRKTPIRRKAQFFMLTGFVIISIFYAVSKWLEPYTIIDTSVAARDEEPAVFSNIKKEALDIIAESKSCKDLVNNLKEFKNYLEGYAFKKLIIYFDFSLETPCYEEDPMFPALVLFDIELSSSRITVRDEFYGFWPPGSEPV